VLTPQSRRAIGGFRVFGKELSRSCTGSICTLIESLRLRYRAGREKESHA